MSELTAATAPAPSPIGVAKVATALAAAEGDGNEISVLLTANYRLQITADVDAAGLEKLEQMLVKYKEILALLQ
ncbi:hypothetical protein [Bradyrhizobium genosp. P]|uniref:hypothetical protein n=1 Tax=Bradyrhizobium genosp. P TaxID=83641 RepID=UPI003CEFC30E